MSLRGFRDKLGKQKKGDYYWIVPGGEINPRDSPWWTFGKAVGYVRRGIIPAGGQRADQVGEEIVLDVAALVAIIRVARIRRSI